MPEGKLVSIETCIFQRYQKGPWETGLALNEGGLGYLDANGNKVEEVWNSRIILTGMAINVKWYLDKPVSERGQIQC